ncbi:MAG: hypothetical protein PHO91_03900 [Patescibacteria group bacterium]|nr:hypothetical protein [Patescibacteria group bacterium]
MKLKPLKYLFFLAVVLLQSVSVDNDSMVDEYKPSYRMDSVFNLSAVMVTDGLTTTYTKVSVAEVLNNKIN